MPEQLPLQFEFRANYTFADFYPGANLEIIEHLKNTVAGTGEPFVVLWGKPGQGKSHLLQACCHLAQTLAIPAFYFDLAHSLPDSGLLKGLEDFDLVCFDNIDFLAGHTEWEHAFFNFFNRHYDRRHRLILTSSDAPQILPYGLTDLKTRLNWGLTLKLKELSDADCKAALIFKAHRLGFDLPESAAHYLICHYPNDIALQWQLLDCVSHASLAAKRKLTAPFLKEVLESKAFAK
jgi:DnaA family protein